ncbi:TRAP transporter solute receptor, TAXI family [Alteromonadaceae bacterium Bs31]|nr:TRAP transporter solute receptor, TAXI family [Alteromonadaceae bacterium Bs31]
MRTERLNHLNIKITVGAVTTLILLVSAAVLFSFQYSTRWPATLTIATGFSGGVYDRLGEGLAESIDAHINRQVSARQFSSGSIENMQMIGDGLADLAFVQSDTSGNDKVRVIATLYDEVLHVIVPVGQNYRYGLKSLEGKKIAIGPEGSGTKAVAEKLLSHFSIAYQPASLPMENMISAFETESIDAAIVLTAINSPITQKLLASGKFTLLSLDRGDSSGDETLALSQVYPHYKAFKIFPRVYGRYPEDTIHTLSVTATLVGRAGLSSSLVREITELLFASRSKLAEKHSAAEQLREQWNALDVQYPFHQGAIDYYNRSKPLFIVQYSEVFSLVLSLVMLVFAGITGLNTWIDSRTKNFIDEFYKKVHTLELNFNDQSIDQLDHTMQEAVDNLIHERLEANTSFQILQSLVLNRMVKLLLLELANNQKADNT